MEFRHCIAILGLCVTGSLAMADDLGDCRQTGDSALRVRACGVLLARNPADLNALVGRANAYGVLGEHQRAIADYDGALKISPSYPLLHINRADSYVAIGENLRAIADIESGLRLIGGRNTELMAIAHNTRARAYGNGNDLPRALADFQKAIELSPKLSLAYCNRGFFLSAAGHQDPAIADFDACLKLDPNNPATYLNRALANRRKGDNPQAIIDAGEALKHAPGMVDAYLTRGNAYVAIDKHDEAIADLTKAIELKPDSARLYNSRGMAHEKKGERERAIAEYRKALSIDPSYPFARNNLQTLGVTP